MEAVPLEEWPKIQRYRKVRALVTEKIDGTNAQIYIPDDPAAPLLAGSRNRWLTPISVSGKAGSDNFDFASFVLANAEVLAKTGLPEGLPSEVELVPTLYHGEFNPDSIDDAIRGLYRGGSVAVPGFGNPEGVVILVGGGPGAMRLKVTDGNDEPKWKTKALRVTGVGGGGGEPGGENQGGGVGQVLDPTKSVVV